MNVTKDVTAALRAQEHGHQPIVFEPGAASRIGGHIYEDGVTGTIRADAGDNQQAIVVNKSAGFDGNMGAKAGNIGYAEEIAPTLNAGKQMSVVCIEGNGSRPSHKGDGFGKESDAAINAECAVSINASGVSYVSNYIVRRLTPMECERLQGFPDNWTNIGEWVDSKGKVHKDADSPRYKALGNSIALPFWEWLAERMIKVLDVDHPTMASLFDGIGGFPLVFSRAGCETLWISEIEEFPLAVTRKRFED